MSNYRELAFQKHCISFLFMLILLIRISVLFDIEAKTTQLEIQVLQCKKQITETVSEQFPTESTKRREIYRAREAGMSLGEHWTHPRSYYLGTWTDDRETRKEGSLVGISTAEQIYK